MNKMNKIKESYQNALNVFLTEVKTLDALYNKYAEIELTTEVSDGLKFTRSGYINNIYDKQDDK